ncbi:MAG: ABC transporter permease, partial [Lentisphaeraceae bacterium]|nr:ABC transporter permease [Lentisphaeraceae bacterium]
VDTGKEAILSELKKAGPQAAGLIVRDIRAEAKNAAAQGIDFGMLFLSMSFFIITAALILTALLHAFHMEKRRQEMGIMLACGFTQKDVRNRFLKEGFLLTLIALIPGIPLGIFYTSKIINFLSTIWLDAVGTTEIYLHVSPTSLAAGSISFIIFAVLTLWLVIRRFLKRHTVELINEEEQQSNFKPANLRFAKAGTIILVGAVLIVILGKDRQFATSSFLLLAAVLSLSHGLIEKIRAGKHKTLQSMNGLIIRNLSRKSARSLGAVLLMACGTFLVLNTVARQKTLSFDASDNKSGTGGFEYFAQTSISLRYKPDTKEGQDEFGVEAELLKDSKVVSIRYHRGDDASCLNLNRAQQPQIYGVTPSDLSGRFNLSDEQWGLLDQELPERVIPAIGDENTVLWGLGLYAGVGSQITIKDEKGRDVKLQIVALLKNSILQGALITNRTNFDKLYPAESGYHIFMIDPPNDDLNSLKDNFKMSFEDYGITIHDSAERLRNFLKIEATYLIIFQMLGGLGLILGALGFGFIILRNVQDRQGELATLKAIGFLNKDIASNLFKEHCILLLWAVFCGTITALISWIPLLVTNASLPLGRILTILALILLVGVISCFLSSRASTKFKFLEILKNE